MFLLGADGRHQGGVARVEHVIRLAHVHIIHPEIVNIGAVFQHGELAALLQEIGGIANGQRLR